VRAEVRRLQDLVVEGGGCRARCVRHAWSQPS
jgi:hypothetical protein